MSRARRDGYATPAAAVITMAIALVTTAGMTRALAELRLSKAEFAKTRAEYAFAAAQNAAMLAIATSNRPPPYHWTIASLGSALDVVAEPERAKMSLAALASLDDAALANLGVADPAALRTRLAQSAGADGLIWVEDGASSPLWRSCGAALASPFGAASQPPPLDYSEPLAGQRAGNWRAGEVWRIQVTAPDGWRDERIVRFTGNGLTPAAVVGRRLSRGWKGDQTCELTLDAAAGAGA
jgi:hypothetical protein